MEDGVQLTFFFCPAYFYGLVDRNMGELPTDAFEESKWRWSCGYANIRILRNFSIRMIVERLEGLPLKIYIIEIDNVIFIVM